MDLSNPEIWKQLGGLGGGVGILALLAWQIYQKVKEDRKGSTIDQRIDAYSVKLQETIDKLVTKLETLGTMRDKLVLENATFSAQLTVAKNEIDELKLEVEKHIARIRVLEGYLKDNRIPYV